jgi:hypothetical protein
MDNLSSREVHKGARTSGVALAKPILQICL